MRFFSLTICLFLFTFLSNAQTNIGGIVNDYAAVQSLVRCNGRVTVADASAFAAGDLVLLIQMQGAIINQSNSSSFGTISQYGGAGFYELATVEAVNGNVVRLRHEIIRNYNTNGAVQLIKVPRYQDATVVSPLTAQAWNGSTGGVLAIDVAGSLTLEAPINVDGLGFRGGQVQIVTSNCQWFNDQNDWYYSIGNWRGSAKGEGIAKFITDREWGRGPQANGGGGANDHNAGGGGGSHASLGGQGGNQTPNSTFGCSGNFPGRGGLRLDSLGQRLFMGGGGGAGHVDNTGAGMSGQRGGGIAIVRAGTLIGNNLTISANGASSPSANGDGGGGAGAGGSVRLSIQNYIGNVNLNGRGGEGGDIGAITGRCGGPGGGGSGGRLAFSGGTVTGDVAGGRAGINTSASSTCNGSSNGALAGAAGIAEVIGTALPQGSTLIVPFQLIESPVTPLVGCEGDDLQVIGVVTGNGNVFRWQINDGTGFVNLTNVGSYNGTNTPILRINNITSAMDGDMFRLQISNTCYDTTLFLPVTLNVTLGVTATVDAVFQGNNSYQFSLPGFMGTVVSWDFGDGQQSTLPNPSHTFAQAGTYEVEATVNGPCGPVVIPYTLVLGAAPVAVFSIMQTSPCAPSSIAFTSESTGNNLIYRWSFPGGTPAMSTLPNPVVNYPAAGLYDATLIVTNVFGTDSIFIDNLVEVQAAPTGSITSTVNGNTVDFSLFSPTADSVYWAFGDGMNSFQIQPSHTYAATGAYTATIQLFNPCGVTTLTYPVAIGGFPNASFNATSFNGCAPLNTTFQSTSSGTNLTFLWSFPGGIPATSTSPNPQVRYDSVGVYDVTLTVTNALGNSILTSNEVIEVFVLPTADFEVSLAGKVATFTNLSVNADAFTWNFGDGSPLSFALNPVHTYATGGNFSASLTAANLYCGNGITKILQVIPSATNSVSPIEITVYPNPTTDQLYLKGVPENTLLEISDLQGKKLIRQWSSTTESMLSLGHLPSGVYILTGKSKEGGLFSAKVMKR